MMIDLISGKTRDNIIEKCGFDIFAMDVQTLDTLLPVLEDRMLNLLARMEIS